MEKNVPLLKLIQDPWSIKTVTVTFYVCPSASLRSLQQQYIPSPEGFCNLMQDNRIKGIIIKIKTKQKKQMKGSGKQGSTKTDFLFGTFSPLRTRWMYCCWVSHS